MEEKHIEEMHYLYFTHFIKMLYTSLFNSFLDISLSFLDKRCMIHTFINFIILQ